MMSENKPVSVEVSRTIDRGAYREISNQIIEGLGMDITRMQRLTIDIDTSGITVTAVVLGKYDEELKGIGWQVLGEELNRPRKE